jgi:hypothetical protein
MTHRAPERQAAAEQDEERQRAPRDRDAREDLIHNAM